MSDKAEQRRQRILVGGSLSFLAVCVLAVAFGFVVTSSPEGPAPGVAEPPVGANPSHPLGTTGVPPTHAWEPIDPAALELDSVMGISVDDVIDQLIRECAAGYLDSCGYLIDQLTADCANAEALSCDILYWVSPVGSDYELYGATCGGRFEPDYAMGACNDL